MSIPQPIFCCGFTASSATNSQGKLHNDPNRELHEAIYQSFLAFASGRERAAALIALITGEDREPVTPPSTSESTVSSTPTILFTAEALANNPVKPTTKYVLHLTSRHDFGPVFSHRYFVCPEDLTQDWVEAVRSNAHIKKTRELYESETRYEPRYSCCNNISAA